MLARASRALLDLLGRVRIALKRRRRRAKDAWAVSDRERLKYEYFGVAADYYAVGRFAFWTGSMGVCGNLLHHAIEMFLKGHLLLLMTPGQLKRLNHNLPRIWRTFKKTMADPRLDAFDRTIRNVHAFESLRYPDSLLETGAVFNFEVTRAGLDWSQSQTKVLGNPRRYMLALEEVDRLVLLLFEVCSCNPEVFLRGKLPHPDRSRFLAQSNAVWSNGASQSGDQERKTC